MKEKRKQKLNPFVKSKFMKSFFCFVILLSAICGQAQQTLPTGGTESQNQIDAPKTVAVSGDNPTAVHFSPKTTAPTAIEWAQDEYITAPFSLQQPSVFSASLQAGTFATTDGVVPFWMRSRKFGSVPLDGLSASLIGAAHKSYKTGHFKPLLDWGAGIDARFNAGSKTEVILVEAYAKARIGKLQLKAGRSREQIGLVDSTLSSGAFILSGNALGIPKIEISLHDYWDIPFTNGVLAVKGSFAHGWLGKFKLNKADDNSFLINEVESYWHQKSFYARLGKSSWKVRFYGGFNHQVIWGNEDQIFADWGLSKAETFKYVFIGKAYGTQTIPASKVGNHSGSIDQGMELDLGTVRLTGYHQFFYEVGALIKLANVADGLWGASLINLNREEKPFQWNKFLVEFLYTLSQGGEIDSKPRPSGPEDYYNNFMYYDGWSYNGENLGNPFITPRKYARANLPTEWLQYYSNNRLAALHAAGDFSVKNWHCIVFLSYSSNLGTYYTSHGARLGGDNVSLFGPPYFPRVNQFSTYMTCKKQLRRGLDLGIELAFDHGDLLNNAVGAGVSLTKTW